MVGQIKINGKGAQRGNVQSDSCKQLLQITSWWKWKPETIINADAKEAWRDDAAIWTNREENQYTREQSVNS
jgi:hypothetical protein